MPRTPEQLIHSHHPAARLEKEKDFQAEIESLFLNEGIEHIREYRLSKKDIPDFWIPETGTVLEVKTAKGFISILRQLKRYAIHDQVKSLILITNHPKGGALPDSLHGKPLKTIEIWKWNL